MAFFPDAESLDSQFSKEYTIVGILDTISNAATGFDSSACLDAFTLCSNPNNLQTTKANSSKLSTLYVNYTDEGEKEYINVTAQLTGISESLLEGLIGKYQNFDSMLNEETAANCNISGLTGLSSNQSVLSAKGVIPNYSDNTIFVIVIILIVIVMLTSIFIIKNSISISATEKMRLYGMLSSIGTTPTQIRNSVIFEGLVMTAVGMPLGLILGLGVTVALIGVCSNLLSQNLGGNMLIFSVPLWSLGVSAILSIITVFLSSLSVSIASSKISPIEAMKETKDVKVHGSNDEKSYRVPKFVGRLFGAGGSIAWKNMQRSRRQYRTTIASLVLSIILFLTSSTYVNALNGQMYREFGSYDYSIGISSASSNNLEDSDTENPQQTKNLALTYKRFFDSVSQNEKVTGYSYCFACSNYIFNIKGDAGYVYKDLGVPDLTFFKNSDDTFGYQLTIMAFDEETYAEFIKPTGKSAEELRGKAVLVNSNRWVQTNEDHTKTTVYKPIFKDPVGMTFTGKFSSVDYDDTFNESQPGINIQIGAEITTDQGLKALPAERFFYGALAPRSGLIVVQLNDFMKNGETWFSYSDMFIDSNEASKLESDISEMSFDEYFTVNNIEDTVNSLKSTILVMQIFIYGFVAAITLIGLTNIINTVTTNMKLRQREFAMLRSIGMTKHEFDSMIRLESIFCSAKALLIGAPVGLLLGWGMCELMDSINNAYVYEKSYVFPLFELILSIAVVIGIIWLAMSYSVSKIRKQNIIETIRNENI